MTRLWQLRTVLPAAMFLAFAFDLGARLVPLGWLSYHTFEPALRQWHTSIGPFEPGRVVVKEHAYGDLGVLGNLHSFREYRRQEFRVDQLGYRNSPLPDGTTYAGIVLGDSFVIGIDEPDEFTLPGQLTKLSGAHYYNAGSGPFPPLDTLAKIASRLRVSSGVVVVELLERRTRLAPSPLQMVAKPAPRPSTSVLPAIFAPVGRLLALKLEIQSRFPSPGRILCQRIFKQVQDGVILPNRYACRVYTKKLINGDELLIYPEDLDQVGNIDALSTGWSSLVAAFRDRLAEQNLKVVVLIVPNKFTVYAPLSQTTLNDPGGAPLLETLENKLRSRGVPVVNVTSAFRREAANRLPRHEYLYWRDDTHWNASAIQIAAELVWREIQKVEGKEVTKR